MRKLKPIPIAAARRVAEAYGYDQIIIIARRVGREPDPHGEHVTTYGATKAHCSVAGKLGDFLKYRVMRWAAPLDYNPYNSDRCPHCGTMDKGVHAFWCRNHWSRDQ